MNPRRFTPEQIEQADNVDLLSYVLSRGYEVRQKGNQHYLVEHESLCIHENKWYWFSQQKGGKTISFLTVYEGMPFVQAVKLLLGDQTNITPRYQPTYMIAPKKKLILPKAADNNDEAFTYLQGRGIDPEIIHRCIDNGTIYQSVNDQVVFVGKDMDGIPRHAACRDIHGKGKYDAKGSDKAYAFSMTLKYCKSLWVFESAIDLLSHITLCGLSNESHRISLGGVSSAALKQFLNDHKEVEIIYTGLDNDEPGRKANRAILDELGGGYRIYDCIPEMSKDYNEYLKYMRHSVVDLKSDPKFM